MDKAGLLSALEADIIADKVCAELALQATQLVFGSGSPDANIMFIGEAPGKNEDIQGVPFVGAAGKFLDEMLRAARLGRADVYITNIVKYRPPGNRDPSPGEKQEFWPYLMRQIEIISPKAIVPLGRHSGMAFIPDLQISRDHGRLHTVQFHDRGYTVIPLYHPAAALYNGSMRQVLIDDFIRAVDIIDKL